MADYFTKLPRVPSPLEVMRKMGLNVPSEKGLANLFTVLPEVIGPQADIAGMVKDAKQIVPLIQSGSYGPALSSLGMATSAIPMMFLPGTVAGVKEGVKESVGSIKGAPLYEKLNPDKFKSGTPYAEKDWDKADGWRDYVDARKTAEKKASKSKGKPKGVDVPYTKLKLKPEEIEEFDRGRLFEPSSEYTPPLFTNPANLQGGYLTNLYGDRSDIGILAGIKGKPFDTPVILDGGHGYMRGLGTGAWASHPNVIKKISNKIKSVEGDPVFGAYVPMSGEATDFAVKTLKTAFNNFDIKMLPKKDIKDFNKTLKKTSKKFPGLDSPKFNEWANEAGVHRYDLMKELAKSKWRDKGFPDIAAARHAVQDPNLRMLPSGNEALGGQSIARMNPDGTMTPVSELPMPHTTYQMDLAGDYVGGLQTPVPRSILFSDWYNLRRGVNAPISSDNKSFMSNVLLQPTNQQWVDEVSTFLQNQGK